MASGYLAKSEQRMAGRGLGKSGRPLNNGSALESFAKSTITEMSTEVMIEKIRKGAYLRKPKFSHFSEIIALENTGRIENTGRLENSSLPQASGLSDLTKLRMEHDFRQQSQRQAKNSVKFENFASHVTYQIITSANFYVKNLLETHF